MKKLIELINNNDVLIRKQVNTLLEITERLKTSIEDLEREIVVLDRQTGKEINNRLACEYFNQLKHELAVLKENQDYKKSMEKLIELN